MQHIDIQLRPSKQFISLIALVLLGSLVVIVSLPLSPWIKTLLILAALAYGLRILWVMALLKSPHSIVGVHLFAEGACKIHYPSNTLAADIKGDSTVTTVVCILRLTVQGKRLKQACVIFSDSLEREHYRQLLVWLAMGTKIR